MTMLPVTLVLAAACGLINLWLGLRLVRGRMGGVPIGDGGKPEMLAGMRAHANFAEYAPLVVILTALIELARGPSLLLWADRGVRRRAAGPSARHVAPGAQCAACRRRDGHVDRDCGARRLGAGDRLSGQ